jgi:hypothetical protein
MWARELNWHSLAELEETFACERAVLHEKINHQVAF